MNNSEDRGWWDRKDGKALIDNPYEPGSRDARDWERGWATAKAQGHGTPRGEGF
jgi:hypothetical protein